MTDYAARPRSYSQLSCYEQCPRSYYLERVAAAWQRPAAWFATGNAVHRAVEAFEKGHVNSDSEVLAVAQTAYREDINSRLGDTPRAEYWQASGRYRGPEDIPRRYGLLPSHLQNYRGLRERLPELLDAGVERRVEVDLAGVTVIGYADQVRAGTIVDIKSGSVVPRDPTQLKVYSVALERETGERFDTGAYVMTAKNRVIQHDLTTISVESVTARFHALDEGVKTGRFPATPTDACRRCSVLTSCAEGQEYQRGHR